MNLYIGQGSLTCSGTGSAKQRPLSDQAFGCVWHLALETCKLHSPMSGVEVLP